ERPSANHRPEGSSHDSANNQSAPVSWVNQDANGNRHQKPETPKKSAQTAPEFRNQLTIRRFAKLTSSTKPVKTVIIATIASNKPGIPNACKTGHAISATTRDSASWTHTNLETKPQPIISVRFK